MPRGFSSPLLAADPLRAVRILRYVSLACQALALAVVARALHIDLPYLALAAVILAGLAFNLWARRRGAACTGRLPDALLVELLFDLAQLGALLALSGGAANPFVTLLLLPVAIAAAAVPGWRCTVVALGALGCYGVLLVAAPGLARAHGDFELHVLGMWLGFVVAVAVVTLLVAEIGRTVACQREALTAAREQAARDDRLVALGALAASTAHELNTPLNTLALLAEELGEGGARPERAGEMAAEIERCRVALQRLAAAAGQVAVSAGAARPLDSYLEELLAGYRRTRPGVHLDAHCTGPRPAPQVLAEATLSGALLSLLDNAAQASPHEVGCEAHWDEAALEVEIRDRGPGISAAARAAAGAQPYSERPGGLGLGLYLSRLAVERLGGRVHLEAAPGAGTRVRVRLPLEPLRVTR